MACGADTPLVGSKCYNIGRITHERCYNTYFGVLQSWREVWGEFFTQFFVDIITKQSDGQVKPVH